MEGGLDLDLERLVAAPDYGKQLLRHLDEPLGPARLLRLKGIHLDGQLRGADNVGIIDELPALKLRAITQIGVFGQRIVLPAAGVVNGRAPPHAGGAIEVKEAARKVSGAVLDHEVAVQQNGFDFRQVRIVAVDPRPAALHDCHLGICEIMNHFTQNHGRRHEVRVEDGDKLALGALHARGERAGFVTLAIVPMMVTDGVTGARVLTHQTRADNAGLVDRVVEHLDFQQLARVVDARNGFEQAFHHIALVENRELDGDTRQLRELLRRLRRLAAALHVQIDEIVAMNAVDRKNNENSEVRNQYREVESVRSVDAAERIFVEDLVEIVHHGVRGGDQYSEKQLMHDNSRDLFEGSPIHYTS